MYVKIDNISFKYENSNEDILKDFSLEINKGEIVSILGKSGCGKSTLLRLIAGLEAPYEGRISVLEKVLVDDKNFIQPEKREVGMLFQDYALFPHLTVEENIRFGLHKFKKEEQDKRIKEVLELINLKEYKKRYPYELSGGQMQRIALARALAPKPSILLMDEPFSNIDSELRSKLRLEVKRILEEENATCIFVTHDIEDVNAISTRTIKL